MRPKPRGRRKIQPCPAAAGTGTIWAVCGAAALEAAAGASAGADDDAPFALHAEAFPSPTRKGYHLLHIGLKGRVVSDEDRKPKPFGMPTL